MASFDIISATKSAYQTIWQERSYLLRLAAFPLFLQFVCMVFAASASRDENYFREGLIMIPAMMAQGWMAAHYARLIVLGHRWPFRLTGNVESDLASLRLRARGVLSGMLVFTLIAMAVQLFKAGAMTIFKPYIPLDGASAPPDIPPQIHMLSWVMFIGLIWCVRYAWAYIPYALNLTGASFLQAVRGWSVSLNIIGAWLLCFVPILFLYSLIAEALMSGGANSAAYLVMLGLNASLEILYTLLMTGAMTYGLRELYAKAEGAGKR